MPRSAPYRLLLQLVGTPDSDIGQRLAVRLLAFGETRFGDELNKALGFFVDASETLEFARSWLLYHARFAGKTIVEWFLADPKRRLSASDRAWLVAQQQTWFGFWEVLDVTPRESLRVIDRLSGTERTVRSKTPSRTLKVGDTVFGRVVDYDGASLLDAMYPLVLSPLDAEELLDRVRRHVRRRGLVPVDRLREPKLQRYLIVVWEEALPFGWEGVSHPSALMNADGEEILWTVDHFACNVRDRARIAAAVTALDDVRPPASDDKQRMFAFTRPPGDIIGTFRFTRLGVALETNSLARASQLRTKLEQAVKGLIRHRIREHPSGYVASSESA